MGGYIKLHRKLIQWEWFTEVNTCHLFLYCLLRANHKDKKYRGTLVKRGEFLTSLEILAAENNLSVRQIRTSLKNLESTGEVTRESTNKGTKITVCNYDSYQSLDNQSDMQNDMQATNERQASDMQATTNKNEKNDNNKTLLWLENANHNYLDICKELHRVLRSHNKISKNKNWKTQAWYDGIRLLVERDGVALHDVIHAVEYYDNHVGDEFMLVIESPKSLRSKWHRLQERIKKETQTPTRQPDWIGERL